MPAIARSLLLLACSVASIAAFADAADKPTPASVEDNIRAMDTDHDGMVSVSEIRAHLEAKHGKDYEKNLLNEIETKATAKSCASPFTRSFY